MYTQVTKMKTNVKSISERNVYLFRLVKFI